MYYILNYPLAHLSVCSQVGHGGGRYLAKGLHNTRVWVGGLPGDVAEEEVRDLFSAQDDIV